MSNLRKYKTMELDFNHLDIEEIMKNDKELQDAVAKLQKALKEATNYLNGTCRRLAFAMLLEIIPQRYIIHVMNRSGPFYTGICSNLIRSMTCDGMTGAELDDLKDHTSNTKAFVTTIEEMW